MTLFPEIWLGAVVCLIFVKDEGICRCCWSLGLSNIMFNDNTFELLYSVGVYNLVMCWDRAFGGD